MELTVSLLLPFLMRLFLFSPICKASPLLIFSEITLQSANNLVVVIHNSLELSVKFSQPDVIVHCDLVNFHDFKGSIQRAFLVKSVRSFEPDSTCSFSNQLFSQAFSRKLYLSQQGHFGTSCHICLLQPSYFCICTSFLSKLRLLCCNPNIL